MAKPTSSLANWPALDAQLGEEYLRVASYNVHRCVGADGREDAVRIASVIAETGCDTIGLQEVHHDNSLDLLASTLGMHAVPGLTLLRHDGHYGNALLTRRNVLAVRRHELTHLHREPRNALDVDLEVCGETVRIIVTHLGLFPGERRYQMRKLLKLLRETPLSERVVVVGDINEWLPLGRPVRWMHALLGHSPAERSFPARWPLFALDRVWVRPRHALIACGVHRSPLAVAASDHLPVKALLATHATQVRAQESHRHLPHVARAATSS